MSPKHTALRNLELKTETLSLRTEAGMSQNQLAVFSGLSIHTIRKVERASSHEALDRVGVGTLRAIARALEVGLEELYPGITD